MIIIIFIMIIIKKTKSDSEKLKIQVSKLTSNVKLTNNHQKFKKLPQEFQE